MRDGSSTLTCDHAHICSSKSLTSGLSHLINHCFRVMLGLVTALGSDFPEGQRLHPSSL